MRPRQNYVMSNNDNDGKLADTIYIICWGVDEPTLYAIFSKIFFGKYLIMTAIFRKSEINVVQNYLGQVSVSVSLFHRTLPGYYAEWMHANC